MICAKETKNENFAGYDLVREIGKGGFGVVYEAKDQNGTRFALKVMRSTPFVSEEYLKQVMQNTVEVSRKCAGLNVVGALASGVFDGKYYIVSRYFNNGSLEHFLKKNNLSLSQKLNILLSMAETLSLIHSKGIIHGDIKPANFLISDEGTPFVGDFYFDINKNSLSSGMPKGTIEYMSPEQAQGRLFSYQSDVYSLGVLAYYILTGLSPFQNARSIRNLIKDKINGKVQVPSAIQREISSKLSQIILKAMAPDLRDRYKNMNDFANELKKCI